MNILDYRSDKYSRCGNDGIIEFILNTAGIPQGTFVEFGAWDGILGSNCRKLFEEGWNGIFIEPDAKRYADLCQNYGGKGSITCLKSMVCVDSPLFDDIVDPYVDHISFCSIDIDGLDVEVFGTFKKHLPDVICIEGGQMLPWDYPMVPKKVAAHNIQQSLWGITQVAENKGYKIVCSYQDTFLVKAEYYDKFDVSDNMKDLYLDGIKVLARRLPWIQKTLSEVDLQNWVVDDILKECGYDKYGWSRRKKWAEAEDEAICKCVEDIRESPLF